MQRTAFDFDVVTGPAVTRPTPKPAPKPTVEPKNPASPTDK